MNEFAIILLFVIIIWLGIITRWIYFRRCEECELLTTLQHAINRCETAAKQCTVAMPADDVTLEWHNDAIISPDDRTAEMRRPEGIKS